MSLRTLWASVRSLCGYNYPDYDPAGHDDHLVKARDADATAVGGLAEKTIGASGVTLSVVTDGGVEKLKIEGPTLPAADDHKVKRDADADPVYGRELLYSPNESISLISDPETPAIDIQVECSEELPLSDGIAASGDPSEKPASIKHVHPLVDASSVGGKLYTAVVPSPAQHPDVDCIYSGGWSGWTQIATGRWLKYDTGELATGVLDGRSPTTGMRVLDKDTSPDSGIYVIDDTGASTANPNVVLYLQSDGSLGPGLPAANTLTSGFNATSKATAISLTTETADDIPSLISWAGGIVPVTIYARVRNPTNGAHYALDLGQTPEVRSLNRLPLVGDVSPYQSYHSETVSVMGLTGEVQCITFYVPVDTLTTLTSDRLELILRAYTSIENDSALFEVSVGIGTPSRVDTLFPTQPSPHSAQMHRASDMDESAEVVHGAWVHVQYGAVHENSFWQITTADPIELGVTSLAWEGVSDPGNTDTNELLTAAQLSLASPITMVAGAGASGGEGEVEIVTCTERTLDLEGVTIPGDKPIVCHVRAAIGVDTDSTTVIRVYLRGTSDPSWHLVGTTQALHNVDAGDFVCPACTLGADYPMGIGEKLEASFRVFTDRVGGATVTLTYNNAEHSTYIALPLTFGFAGTDEHDKLTEPSRCLPNQHPIASSYHDDGTVDAAAIPTGLLTPPGGKNIVKLTGSPTIIGIDVRPFAKTGCGRLTLFFVDGGHITNNGVPGDSNFAPMVAGNSGGLSPADAASMDFGTKGMVDLVLIDNAEWHPPSPPNTGTS